jgi:hypothetical protein
VLPALRFGTQDFSDVVKSTILNAFRPKNSREDALKALRAHIEQYLHSNGVKIYVINTKNADLFRTSQAHKNVICVVIEEGKKEAVGGSVVVQIENSENRVCIPCKLSSRIQ